MPRLGNDKRNVLSLDAIHLGCAEYPGTSPSIMRFLIRRRTLRIAAVVRARRWLRGARRQFHDEAVVEL